MQEQKQFKNSEEVRAYMAKIKRDYRLRKKEALAAQVHGQTAKAPEQSNHKGGKANNN